MAAHRLCIWALPINWVEVVPSLVLLVSIQLLLLKESLTVLACFLA